VINAILLGLARNKNSYNIYNVANDDQITVNGIADIVIREMGLKNVKISYTGGDRGWRGDIPVVKLDNTKIKTELGWNYQYNSREAITKSVKEMLGKE
jgi:UDP-glucose 4-epimerase